MVLGLFGALALATGACTSSSNNNGQRDAGQEDGPFHQLDGSTGGDGGGGDGGGGTCTKTGLTAAVEYADYKTDGTDEWFTYYALTAETSPYDALGIELYPGYGAAPTLGAGTYTLGATAAEQSYATCGVCVLLYGGCDDTAQTCAKTYFAQTGTLTITALDNASGFVASLANATLAEVTIDSNNVTTKVPGGATWCFPSHSINAELTTAFPCTSNTECASQTDTPYCDTASGYCVQCLLETHCSGLTATPHCDPDYFECVECVTNDHCASSANGHFCGGGLCGQCAWSGDCTNPATPVCVSNSTTYRGECVAGGTCTGDDGAEPGDDGAVGARALTIGTAMNGSICKATNESDFYKVTTSATGNITFTANWTETGADLDLYAYTATGTLIDYAEETTVGSETLALTAQPAGTYYVEVWAYSHGSGTNAIPYTITVTTP
jgi:hypothetical protein